ncbi:uncharacterized protein [Linepithema humile]|uniref:uncharacterized protein n=1 Tax=Linepithema humile TaxID=83485 RepID=UPI00351F72BF
MSRNSVLSSVPAAQAISLLASQIPSFGGTQDENIELWLRKVERVSRIHCVSEDITLLAATSKLTKLAREWFDLDTGTINDTWTSFKQAVIRRFHRQIPFCVIVQKVEARRWNFTKETFQEYALNKLRLMQNMNLSDSDAINFLISGIGSASLRATAASLDAITVDQFLEKMHNITIVSGDLGKKQSSFYKAEKMKPSDSTVKNIDSTKVNKDNFCVYCKNKGHIRSDCLKLKKKEQFQQSTSLPTKQPVVAAVDASADAAAAVPADSSSSLVASIAPQSAKRLEISDPQIKVLTINNITCNLFALVDSGSPTSFIRPSLFHRYFDRTTSINVAIRSYMGLNSLPIPVLGTVSSVICFESLPDFKTDIEFQVLQNDVFAADIIIGRDFLRKHEITVIFSPSAKAADDNLRLIQQVASADVLEESSSSISSLFERISIDFDTQVKKHLIDIVTEVENKEIPVVKDGYSVKVALKDNTTYAFAPRRFAFSERQEMRKITDDLLARDIIQYSSSPYCARIVPVRKRNGSLRLCVSTAAERSGDKTKISFSFD